MAVIAPAASTAVTVAVAPPAPLPLLVKGAVGHGQSGRPCGQTDLLGQRDAYSEEENGYCEYSCLQSSFGIVGSHRYSPHLVRLVDYKFPGINQHHHHHSAGKNIVGGD